MKAEVVVILSKNGCEVALADGTQRRTMACAEVVSYLTSTLKMPRGALFELKTIPDVDEAEFDRLRSGLKAAGYKPTPGVHVGFLTEPKRK
jgi:hypothetical protein